MTLATRCPACGTSFRVVSDQLRVSSGWVRCGRCSSAFDAQEHLFRPDAQRVRASFTAPGSDAARHGPAAAEPVLADPTPKTDPVELMLPTGEPAARGALPAQGEREPVPDLGWARAPDYLPRGRPAFVHRAEASARWSHPATRTTLALLVTLLVLLLAAQAALLWRDEASLRWPATRPALEGLCGLLGCRVEAPHRIQALAVESSELRDETQASGGYRLELVIRNRGTLDVLAPALELTMTDTAGRLLTRRVLTLAELGHPARSVPAGQELLVQAELSTGATPVAGYTIALFYP